MLVIGAGTSAEEVVTGVVSGSNVINCVRGKEGTTDQAHSAGDTVTMYFTETHWDDVMDGILVQHKQDGTHANTITTDTINENTSANGVTIDSLNIKDGALNTNASVIPNNLMASTGTSWAWQSWTPTWTNLTVGNGTVTAKYVQVGKTVIAHLVFVMGSTSSIGTLPDFTLPVTANSRYGTNSHTIGAGYSEDYGAAAYNATPFIQNSTTKCQLRYLAVSGANCVNAQVSATAPFTWGTNDFFSVEIFYETA